MKRFRDQHLSRTKWLTLIPIAASLILGLGFLNAGAQNARPCGDEIGKFCKDVKPGGGDILDCLKQHESELSPACKDHVAQAVKRRDEIQACRGDIDKLCKDNKPGSGRIAKCLKEHLNELSPGCREIVSRTKKK